MNLIVWSGILQTWRWMASWYRPQYHWQFSLLHHQKSISLWYLQVALDCDIQVPLEAFPHPASDLQYQNFDRNQNLKPGFQWKFAKNFKSYPVHLHPNDPTYLHWKGLYFGNHLEPISSLDKREAVFSFSLNLFFGKNHLPGFWNSA